MTLLKKPPFMASAGDKGHNIFAELGIALLVFMIAQTGMGIIQIIGMIGGIFFDPMLANVLIKAEQPAEYSEILQAFTASLWTVLPMLYSNAILILCPILYCKFFEKRKPSSLGFVKKGAVVQYLVGIVCGFVVFSAVFFVCMLLGGVKFGGVSGDISTPSGIGIIAAFFFGYLIQGMAEEVFCRGYLMVTISRRYSVTTGVLASSAVFALLHIANSGLSVLAIVNLFLYGVFAALLMIRFNNIRLAGAFHSVWNFVQGNFYGVSVSGMAKMQSILTSHGTDVSAFINGGDFGLEGGICMTMVMVSGIIALFVSIKLKERKNRTE